METAVRYLLLLLVYLGAGTDVTSAVICNYRTNGKAIHRKYCSERCCDFDETSDGSNVCCSYDDKESIYFGTIASVVIITLAVILCMCYTCYRRKYRQRLLTRYGSSDERFHTLHEHVARSPGHQNRGFTNNLTSDGEAVQHEIHQPPAYVTLPPPYSKTDPAISGSINEFTPAQGPPPAYSAIGQSQTGT